MDTKLLEIKLDCVFNQILVRKLKASVWSCWGLRKSNSGRWELAEKFFPLSILLENKPCIYYETEESSLIKNYFVANENLNNMIDGLTNRECQSNNPYTKIGINLRIKYGHTDIFKRA